MSTNFSTNDSTSSPPSDCFEENSRIQIRDAKVACYSLILLISLIGNILVILVVYKNRNMRKTINFFIVNMAASDLVTPLIVMPLQLTRSFITAWAVSGKLGEALCKILFFLTEIPGPVSVLSLICMALDRFVGVVFPLRLGLISSRVRVTMIIITWVIPLGFASTSLYGMELHTTPKGEGYCAFRWHKNVKTHTQIHSNYFTVTSFVFFIVPLFLLIVLYSIILITLGKRKFPRVNQSQEAKKRNRRVSRSATVIALTIVLVFWICWCPYNIYVFLLVFKFGWSFPKQCGFKTLFAVCQTLTFANSAANPCIYFLLIENYRKGLRTVLPRTLSASLGNNSLRVNRNANRQETQVNDDGDCLELVEPPVN